MSEFLEFVVLLIGWTVACLIMAGAFAWGVILPVIGLLWCIGVL